MGVGACIQDHSGPGASRLLHPRHQLAFAISLAKLTTDSLAGAKSPDRLLDVGEAFSTIDGGLAGSQEVQVGAVQDVDGLHFVPGITTAAAARLRPISKSRRE